MLSVSRIPQTEVYINLICKHRHTCIGVERIAVMCETAHYEVTDRMLFMHFRCHILSQTCTLKLWFSPISMNHKAAGCVCVQECVTHLHESCQRWPVFTLLPQTLWRRRQRSHFASKVRCLNNTLRTHN